MSIAKTEKAARARRIPPFGLVLRQNLEKLLPLARIGLFYDPTPMSEQVSDRRSWRLEAGTPSLPEVHRSIAVTSGRGFWRKLLAFSGPGYLVAVGYMDPGHRATDVAGG